MVQILCHHLGIDDSNQFTQSLALCHPKFDLLFKELSNDLSHMHWNFKSHLTPPDQLREIATTSTSFTSTSSVLLAR